MRVIVTGNAGKIGREAVKALSAAGPRSHDLRDEHHVDLQRVLRLRPSRHPACRLALEAPLAGHERMVIAAADTIVGIPSAELHKTYFPDVELRAPLDGNTSLLSSARARELIGYQPQVSWRHW